MCNTLQISFCYAKITTTMIKFNFLKVNLIIITVVSTFIFFLQTNFIYAQLNSSLTKLHETSSAFNLVADIAKPAVVSISSIRTVQSYRSSPFYNDPYFDHFFDSYRGAQQREGLGSGVIVSKFGHILTNHHVVQRADEITVTLNDGREFKASMIGSDKKTDLAILKIDDTNLPFVKFGNSDSIRVGDWAIAVGNPFGLAGTVTVGIISAKSRSGVVDVENYADFIQTDAAINPGNSGGALLNIKGELIGINTAIFTQSGGYMGIGFAIPISMAKRVMEDIIKYGNVRRGMLGVTVQPITNDLVKKYNLKTKQGALIVDVIPGSAADKAGIQIGDLITELNKKKVTDYLTLRSRISELKLNQKTYCMLQRNGIQKNIYFTLTSPKPALNTSKINNLGLKVINLNRKIRRQLQIPNAVSGVIISAVDPRSTAAKYRLTKGQIITQINNRDINSLTDYEKLITNSRPLLLTIYEDGFKFVVLIKK
jgi:serine protease Do